MRHSSRSGWLPLSGPCPLYRQRWIVHDRVVFHLGGGAVDPAPHGPAENGGSLTPIIRPARPDDEAGLREFLSGLSEQSRYMRFFNSQARADINASALAGCNEHGGIGLVATDASGAVIAHAHLFPSGDGSHEMGIAVADGYQHRGLGTRLLENLGSAARRSSILSYRAVVLSSNEPMLRLLRSTGCVIADAETDFFDLVVGTGGAMPSWPVSADGRPRVLVEGRGWYSSPESNALGSLDCNTLRCTGRLPRYSCPLVSGRSCPLVAEADVVVSAFRPGDPNRSVLEGHLRQPGGTPVVAVGGAQIGGCVVATVPGPGEDRQRFIDSVGRVLIGRAALPAPGADLGSLRGGLSHSAAGPAPAAGAGPTPSGPQENGQRPDRRSQPRPGGVVGERGDGVSAQRPEDETAGQAGAEHTP